MMSPLHRNFSLVGFSFTVPLIAVIWVAVTPGAMSGITPVLLAILATGMTAVVFKTWRSAQPTDSMARVLRRVDAARQGESSGPLRQRRLGAERLYR